MLLRHDDEGAVSYSHCETCNLPWAEHGTKCWDRRMPATPSLGISRHLDEVCPKCNSFICICKPTPAQNLDDLLARQKLLEAIVAEAKGILSGLDENITAVPTSMAHHGLRRTFAALDKFDVARKT